MRPADPSLKDLTIRTVIPSSDLTILRHLASRPPASAAEIRTACGMAPGEVLASLMRVRGPHLIAGRVRRPLFASSLAT